MAIALRYVRVTGSVRPPGDKSITHRALMLAGLARTHVELVGALVSDDTRSTARVLRAMGVHVSPMRNDRSIHVNGCDWQKPRAPLNCGNSGTTARLLLGALAGQPFAVRVTGDSSLRRRPMRRLTIPLRAMGALVTEERGDGLPLSIRGGQLKPFSYRLPVPSAQLKTALLFAGVAGMVPVTLSEPSGSRNHTEVMLQHLGFEVAVDGTTVSLKHVPAAWPSVPAWHVEIPGDLSSAAFLVVAAALAEGGDLEIAEVGVNPTRTGFLNVLQRMGGRVDPKRLREVCGEAAADLVVRPTRLRATEVTAREVPTLIDEIPVLAIAASRAEGESRFRSVGELRVKESDRLGLLASNLRAVGCAARVEGDDLVVTGSSAPPRGDVETAGDHRLAMAFAVLGTLPGATVRLSESRSARVSYPGFFDDIERIRNG